MRKFATCFIAFLVCAPAVVGAAVSRVVPTDIVEKPDVAESTTRSNASRSTVQRTSDVTKKANSEI